MLEFSVIHHDGSPAIAMQVIVTAPGARAYGITDRHGFVSIPFSHSEGKIIIGGRSVYLGYLGVKAIRI